MGQIAARRGRGEFFSTSAEETMGLGEALGRVLGPTDVLVLTGDLGAGKTQLTKGVARGMGVTDDVTSPTVHHRDGLRGLAHAAVPLRPVPPGQRGPAGGHGAV
jgi:hypothetical protein